MIILATFLLVGCSPNIYYNDNDDDVEFAKLQGNYFPEGSLADDDSIRILSSNTKVRHEEFASISIIGKPGETYSISSNYKWDGENVTAFVKRRANNDGVATWVWKVRSNTTPGTYPIIITGGNQRLETSYTVEP